LKGKHVVILQTDSPGQSATFPPGGDNPSCSRTFEVIPVHGQNEKLLTDMIERGEKRKKKLGKIRNPWHCTHNTAPFGPRNITEFSKERFRLVASGEAAGVMSS